MALRSTKGSVSASEGNEWSKLSPAISSKKPAASTASADELLNARRAERTYKVDSAAVSGTADSVFGGHDSPVDSVEPFKPVAFSGEKVEEKTTGSEATSVSSAAPVDQSVRFSTIAEKEEEAQRRAEVREIAVKDRPKALKLRATLIALTIPFVTLMLAIRGVASAPFLWLTYHRPGFPEDSYGFSPDERMTYGSYGMDYVRNLAPESYLANLKTAGGHNLFLSSEVGHMSDVKMVLWWATLGTLLLVVLALLASRSLRNRAPGVIRKSLFAGALIALVLMISLGVLGALGWETLFETFHHVLFPQGNWQFRMSDTLIRLYPPQFWVDAAIAVAAITLLISLLLLALTWPTKYRRELAKRRAEERLELRRRLTEDV